MSWGIIPSGVVASSLDIRLDSMSKSRLNLFVSSFVYQTSECLSTLGMEAISLQVENLTARLDPGELTGEVILFVYSLTESNVECIFCIMKMSERDVATIFFSREAVRCCLGGTYSAGFGFFSGRLCLCVVHIMFGFFR